MLTISYKLKDLYARLHTKYVARAIFVHINKTGGSSIETALGLPFQHRTAVEILATIGARRWSERFSFTFVRNPWDKVASHYHYRVKTNQTGLGVHPIPFAEWVERTYGEQAPPYYDQPKMFMPQIDWIVDQDGEILVDFVGRFESLEADFRKVCERLRRDVRLPHLKKSSQSDYRRYYTDRTAEIVRSWFARDIDTFNYRFE